ncbi:hypothetical protein EIP86_010153 [Pleurotus ostreatoroseus]|nr:hypothetical protein EIP86_010153 [Pleurotus ostreatoroseus]
MSQIDSDVDDDSLIPLTPEQRIGRAISKLPTLTAEQVPPEDTCPICLVPFLTIITGAAQNEGVLNGVAPNPHGTCPTCRHAFLDIKPLTDSDFESSDEDYVPGDDEEEEDDVFMDTEDDWDFDDVEYDAHDGFDTADEQEVDADLWEDHNDGLDNLGLSDGYGSESYSEGELAVSLEGDSYVVDGAKVYTAEDENAVQGASTSANAGASNPKP